MTCLLGRWRLPENCTYLADVWCDLLSVQGFLGGSGIKNPPANAGDMGLIPGWGRSPGEDPLEKEWEPVPVFLPGKSAGQRSLVGYIHRVAKESGMTKQQQERVSIMF